MTEVIPQKKFVINRSVNSTKENESRGNHPIAINTDHVDYITKKHIQDAEKRKNDIKIMKEYEWGLFMDDAINIFIIILVVLFIIVCFSPIFIIMYMQM
jgi:hypothetical protein